ncbi:efflux RND transporter periplasmic adaptor subunit, partial [Negativicoccus succinicivorans]
TPLVTISSTDPIFVTFDLTEAEYLKMTQRQNSSGAWGQELKLQLADGSQYGETGQVVVIDQDMSGGGGQFTVKASFTNPQQILRQGMFVQVISDTEIARNSILIPEQAVQPLLDKKIVTVVDAEHKVSQRPVEVGATYGPYVVITSGIVAGDTVVVEGQAKVRNGQTVQVKMLSRDEVEHPRTKQAAPAAGKQ